MAQHQFSSLPWPELQVLEQRAMPAHREAIAEVVAWLEEIAQTQQWSARVMLALTLCADEALINIVTHAIPVEEGVLQIQLQLGLLPDGVALCIGDNGQAFDPTAREPAQLAESLEQAEVGGHGLRLLRHYLQRFEYQRSAGMNWLLLGVNSAPATRERGE